MSQRLLSFVATLGLLLATSLPIAAGQDSGKFVGTWKSKAKPAALEQVLVIARDGERWTIRGSFENEGGTAGTFVGFVAAPDLRQRPHRAAVVHAVRPEDRRAAVMSAQVAAKVERPRQGAPAGVVVGILRHSPFLPSSGGNCRSMCGEPAFPLLMK